MKAEAVSASYEAALTKLERVVSLRPQGGATPAMERRLAEIEASLNPYKEKYREWHHRFMAAD